jgi:hypothetical protein
MNLDEVQKKKVAEWIAQGAKLSEIQNRVAAEFGLRLTYMDVRFLVDDLKLTPKDPEPPPKPIQPVAAAPVPADAAPLTAGAKPPAGGVSISLDKITKPGALVSGQVTFSDGQPADWHLDETGRLGLASRQAGYRPSAADVQAFQTALQSELAKAGF